MSHLYDEFGNYIGQDISDDEDDRDDVSVSGNMMQLEVANDVGNGSTLLSSVFRDEGALVLHEDKKYYQDAEELYPTAKTVTFNQDAMDISEPIIKPSKVPVAATVPSSSAKGLAEFHLSLMAMPIFTRHVCVLGHIHHGKTSFIGDLLQSTQRLGEEFPDDLTNGEDAGNLKTAKQKMFPRRDEQEREISIKSNLSSAVMQTRTGKSYLINLIDTPGHSNFLDEAIVSLMVSDGALIVVDAIEGVMMSTVVLINAAVSAQNSVCLCINKMDRLVLELKLPPQDAYFKLLHILEEFNNILQAAYDTSATSQPLRRRVGPELGNVCFASSQHGWSFTLESFAGVYAQQQAQKRNENINAIALAKRLWGDWYVNDGREGGAISRTKPSDMAPRTFIHFILEPIYKIYAHVLGSVDDTELMAFLRSVGIKVKRDEICSTTRSMDPSRLLRIIMSRFMGDHCGTVEMIANHISCPSGDAAAKKLHCLYSGSQNSASAEAIRQSSPDGPLIIHVAKLYHNPATNADSDGASKFFALARIYSGTAVTGQGVRILGEAFSPDDDEDMFAGSIEALCVSTDRGSCVVELPMDASVGPGSLVLLRGVDSSIKKTATIVDLQLEDCEIFRPARHGSGSVMKVSIEPIKPAQLPKMMEALRCVCKSYPLMTTKVEGSGEHCLLGPGELYMDCALADLRTLYSDIEVKVSDPVVVFCETVIETSSVKCTAETPNGHNRFAVVAEPMDEGLAIDMEAGLAKVPSSLVGAERKNMEAFFKSKYSWDLMAVHSIWAFGPDPQSGSNVLLDDTLGSKDSLRAVKSSVVQGFRWGCREGPLCDELVRNVKFKILEADVTSQPLHRGGGQVIPTMRRAVYSSFLMATPRLMEPMYRVEIQAPSDCVQALYPVIQRRRGFILEDLAKPGAPFFTLKAYVPVIDRSVKYICSI